MDDCLTYELFPNIEDPDSPSPLPFLHLPLYDQAGNDHHAHDSLYDQCCRAEEETSSRTRIWWRRLGGEYSRQRRVVAQHVVLGHRCCCISILARIRDMCAMCEM